VTGRQLKDWGPLRVSKGRINLAGRRRDGQGEKGQRELVALGQKETVARTG